MERNGSKINRSETEYLEFTFRNERGRNTVKYTVLYTIKFDVLNEVEKSR